MELSGGYRERALDVLRDLVRIDTRNPPGNEIACALYLRDLLAPAGIETEIIESAPGRGNLIARLKGAGQARPLMLMGHTDVVAADPASWQYPPFAAEVHDGFLWGRGATDMKQMIAVSAIIMLALAEQGVSLQRDVMFAATADEEQGGRMGARFLARERREVFDVDCVITEGGGGAIPVGDRVYYTCQTAQKGVCRTVWTAEGQGGHGAHPSHQIAPLALSRALVQLGDGHLGGRAIETMRRAIEIVAADRSGLAGNRSARFLRDGRIEDALTAVGFQGETLLRSRALFYDTAAVTGLSAGDPRSINVIPPAATAYVDGRILPGQDREGFLKLLRGAVGDGVGIDVYEGQYSPGLESPYDAPIVDTISRVIAERCDGAKVIPWQCAGATDARHLAPLGVPVYGFVPAKPMPEGIDGAGAHASNERLWLDNLTFALDVLYDVVYRYCARAGASGTAIEV